MASFIQKNSNLSQNIIQAKSNSPSLSNIEGSFPSDEKALQLKSIVDHSHIQDKNIQLQEKALNTKSTSDLSSIQKKAKNDTIQRKLYTKEGGESQWNQLIDDIEALHTKLNLPNKSDIDKYINIAEGEWYGTEEHSASVNQFNAMIVLKGKVCTGLEQIKEDPNSVSSYNWGEFAKGLNDLAKRYGTVTGPKSTGGHASKTYTYTLGSDSFDLAEETDSHGQTNKNLNTRRGQMKKVLESYNSAIDADIGSVRNSVSIR